MCGDGPGVVGGGELGGKKEEIKLSLDVRVSLVKGEPYMIEDGSFCRDLLLIQVKTSPQMPVFLKGCRQSNGEWLLVNIEDGSTKVLKGVTDANSLLKGLR